MHGEAEMVVSEISRDHSKEHKQKSYHQSRVERKEIVSRCRARKRYLKQLVNATQSLSASHALYLRSLRATGSALVHFFSIEAPLHHLCPGSKNTWTSPALPPPHQASSTWDFWDPFAPPPPSSYEEDWDRETATPKDTTTITGSELAMVASTSNNSKDLLEIIKEINECFIKAAESGSSLLEISTSMDASFSAHSKGGKTYSNYDCNLNPMSLCKRGSSPKLSEVGVAGEMVGLGSHSSTIERLYAWEKKLLQEVKNAESIKMEHEKKVQQVRKLEAKKAENVKTEKAKKDVDKLDSSLMVSSQVIKSASNEIIKLRETQLYPQLVGLAKGMMSMWKSMYESHQVQTHLVQQLKYLNTIPSTEPTSQLHHKSTFQLELEIQQWHHSFCNLIKAQRDYIQSLTGWLRLSLFQFSKIPLVRSNYETKIYNFCEEWHLAMDKIPDKAASEGIESLLTAVHGIVVQQADEQKQKKRTESMFKEFEKKAGALRVLESKYGSFSEPDSGKKNVVVEKRGKVEILKVKAEEEKNKNEKAVSVSRTMTINNLKIGFEHMFQVMVGFSSVCMEAFESVYHQAKSIGEEQQQEVKKLLT
ncbi:PREDICTED: uncharacterized protein LOC104746168 isoform X2 [Camelina sativa]|uniref:Uncharacterized protein LOC104746168 isoform X2 n=1 Tax=Camelina sativa TaxID=90675 RepID=A0ABM0W5B7_CAMSA|nr:PREDICTED: uncharacterized protein LOC104746168 isoform X2 [Camelina sativa]